MLIGRPEELELDDEGTRISLTIVDTPGFGDQIDNEARHVTAASAGFAACKTDRFTALVRLLDTLSASTMISLPKNLESSETPASGTTVSTSFFTSSHRLAMASVSWISN